MIDRSNHSARPLKAQRTSHSLNSDTTQHEHSCNEGGSSCRIVLERWRNLLPCLVVAGETVDTRLNENEAELGVLVLAVDFQVLTDGNSLLDEVPQILRDLWGKT